MCDWFRFHALEIIDHRNPWEAFPLAMTSFIAVVEFVRDNSGLFPRLKPTGKQPIG